MPAVRLTGPAGRLLAGAAIGAGALGSLQALIFWRCHHELLASATNGPLVGLASKAYGRFVGLSAASLLLEHLLLGAITGLFVAGARELALSPASPVLGRTSWALRQIAAVAGLAFVPVLLASAIYPAAFELFFQTLGTPGAALQVALAERVGPFSLEVALGLAGAAGATALLARSGCKWNPRAGRGWAVATTAIAAAAWASQRGPAPQPILPKPHVVLLIADSLRPDYLGVFGHPRPTSPNLDRLARESFVFTRASTVIPRTTASWASLMTGCYPAETGIRTTFARRRAPRPPIATLPRLLADAGYHTAVFADGIEHHLADEHWGFRESRVPEGDYKAFVRHLLLLGSPLLMPYALTEWGRVAWPEVNGGFWLTTDPRHQAGQLARCLEEHGSQPVFAVVFFALCHIPYAAPNPEGLRFVAPGYEGPNRFGRFPDMAGEPVPAGAEQQRVKQLYEGAVASVDAAIGCIRSNLVRMGLEDRTLLIVTSDHGEDLFDTGDRFGHGEHLSPVTVHVPLMVRLPGGRPPVGANDSIVRTIDLAPTVLDLLGMPCPAFMSGVSLEPLLRGRTRDLGLAGYSETDLWLSTAGAFSFQVERVPYPNFQVLCTPDASEGDRMRLNAEYARIVDFAKYRRIWNRRGALEYRPTVAEPHWYREGNPEGLETELDRLMLGRFGFTRGKRGFYLPPED